METQKQQKQVKFSETIEFHTCDDYDREPLLCEPMNSNDKLEFFWFKLHLPRPDKVDEESNSSDSGSI